MAYGPYLIKVQFFYDRECNLSSRKHEGKTRAQRRNESNEALAEVELLFRRVMLSHEPALQVFAKITIGLACARCPIDIPSNNMKKVEKETRDAIKFKRHCIPLNVTKCITNYIMGLKYNVTEVNNLIKSENRIYSNYIQKPNTFYF